MVDQRTLNISQPPMLIQLCEHPCGSERDLVAVTQSAETCLIGKPDDHPDRKITEVHLNLVAQQLAKTFFTHAANTVQTENNRPAAYGCAYLYDTEIFGEWATHKRSNPANTRVLGAVPMDTVFEVECAHAISGEGELDQATLNLLTAAYHANKIVRYALISNILENHPTRDRYTPAQRRTIAQNIDSELVDVYLNKHRLNHPLPQPADPNTTAADLTARMMFFQQRNQNWVPHGVETEISYDDCGCMIDVDFYTQTFVNWRNECGDADCAMHQTFDVNPTQTNKNTTPLTFRSRQQPDADVNGITV